MSVSDIFFFFLINTHLALFVEAIWLRSNMMNGTIPSVIHNLQYLSKSPVQFTVTFTVSHYFALQPSCISTTINGWAIFRVRTTSCSAWYRVVTDSIRRAATFERSKPLHINTCRYIFTFSICIIPRVCRHACSSRLPVWLLCC